MDQFFVDAIMHEPTSIAAEIMSAAPPNSLLRDAASKYPHRKANALGI